MALNISLRATSYASPLLELLLDMTSWYKIASTEHV